MTKVDRYQQILQTIQEKHPEKLCLNVTEVAPLIGVKKGSLYNALSKGICPIRVTRRGGHPRFLIHDIAEYLAS